MNWKIISTRPTQSRDHFMLNIIKLFDSHSVVGGQKTFLVARLGILSLTTWQPSVSVGLLNKLYAIPQPPLSHIRFYYYSQFRGCPFSSRTTSCSSDLLLPHHHHHPFSATEMLFTCPEINCYAYDAYWDWVIGQESHFVPSPVWMSASCCSPQSFNHVLLPRFLVGCITNPPTAIWFTAAGLFVEYRDSPCLAVCFVGQQNRAKESCLPSCCCLSISTRHGSFHIDAASRPCHFPP